MTNPLRAGHTAQFPRFDSDLESAVDRLARDGFTVGDWRVEPRSHRIVRGEIEGSLDPRLLGVLVVLAASPGEVVTRQELLAAVWKGTYVSENSLSKAVSRLRRALGDDRHSPRYIETVSRSGYRLVAPVGRVSRHELVTTVDRQPEIAAREPANNRRHQLLWFGVPAILILAAFLLSSIDRAVPPVPTRVRPELTLPGNQFGPRLAPRGDYVAFAWNGGDAQGNWDLWVQPIGGDAAVQLTDHPHHERLPTWSPDGQRLAFVRFSGEETGCAVLAVQVVGGAEERLGDCLRGMRALAWSPDGQLLAHDGFANPDGRDNPDGVQQPTRTLFLLDLRSGQRRQLTTPPAGSSGDTSVRFSPDGRSLAFERVVGPFREDVGVVDLEDGATRMLTSDSWGQVRGLDWSSDGASILFSSNRAGQFALWKVPASGGAVERVPIFDSWVTQPSVSRAGGRLVYRTFRDAVDVFQLPLDKQGRVADEPILRVPSSRSERQPVWSPAGGKLAFLSDRSGSTEVWSAEISGAEVIRHTRFEGPLPSSPAWSPDGTSIAFDAALHGHSDLWLVDQNARQPRRLTRDPAEERNASFSRDGSSIYFSSDRSGSWQIWRLPVAGGDAVQISSNGGFLARESHDGSLLFFARLQEPGIWSQPTAGGPAKRVTPDLDLSDWGSWDVSTRGIYFLRRQPTAVWFAPFDGSPPTLVYEPANQVPYLGRALSVSSDGSSLLLSLIDRSDDEVMTVDLAGL